MGWWVGTRSLLGVGVDFTLRSAKSAEGWTRNHLVWGKQKYRNPMQFYTANPLDLCF